MKTVIIIMGVSGSGKSTIGKGVAAAMQLPFYDADDFHPQSNIRKMSAGIPLEDTDRHPWLNSLRASILTWQQKAGAVLACSALKESYRQLLTPEGRGVAWVYLHGSFELILQRMQQRRGHFMTAKMLQSQFTTLEPPIYGMQIDISIPPNNIIKNIVKQMNDLVLKSDIGIIGLGVMGKALSLNIADHKYSISVYNRNSEGEEQIVSDFLAAHKGYENLKGFTDLNLFVDSLASPKKILLMIKSGAAVDMVIDQLLPLLVNGDILIDGGNSHYQDTERRSNQLLSKNIHFVGSGISGGEEGARNGPSIMPGGTPESYATLGPILEAISAKDASGLPCCAHVGVGGAGHFVKMVHNGIEYGEMQLLAELYALLSKKFSNEEIAQIFSEWNQQKLNSYLLDITIKILTFRENKEYLLDMILDQAGNKGTGSWSSKAALELGYPNTMMSAAVFARYISSFKLKRMEFSKDLVKPPASSGGIDLEVLKQAYRAAQIINHHQGFELIRQASIKYDWYLNMAEIARIWTNGCIIRSAFMKDCIQYFKNEKQLLDVASIYQEVASGESALRESIQQAMNWRVSTPCLSNAYQYWIAMTTERLPANLIQAQRDYFGAHTYQRIDRPSTQFFHTEWL